MPKLIGEPNVVHRVLARLKEAAGGRFEEEKHPRRKDGKFAPKGNTSSFDKTVEEKEEDVFVSMGKDLPNYERLKKDAGKNPLGLEKKTQETLERWAEAAVKTGKGMKEVVKFVGEGVWGLLPKPAQDVLQGFGFAASLLYKSFKIIDHHVFMKPREWTHRLAMQLAKERGLTDEQVETVGKVTLAVDTILAWTTNIPLVHWGIEEYDHATHAGMGFWTMFGMAKLGYFLPTGSLAYCAYASATQNPLKTVAAAWKLIRGKDIGKKKYTAHHEAKTGEQDILYGPKLAQVLVSRLGTLDKKKHDWWIALFLVGMDYTHDVAHAIALADEHVASGQPDITEPADLTAPIMEYSPLPRTIERATADDVVKEGGDCKEVPERVVGAKEEDRIDDSRGIRYEGPRGGQGWRDLHNGKIKYEAEGWQEGYDGSPPSTGMNRPEEMQSPVKKNKVATSTLPSPATPSPAPVPVPSATPMPVPGAATAPGGAPVPTTAPTPTVSPGTPQRAPGTPPPLPQKKGPPPVPGSVHDLISKGRHKSAWESAKGQIHYGRNPVGGGKVAVRWDSKSEHYLVTDGKKIIATIPRRDSSLLSKYLPSPVKDTEAPAPSSSAKNPEYQAWKEKRDTLDREFQDAHDKHEAETARLFQGKTPQEQQDLAKERYDAYEKNVQPLLNKKREHEQSGKDDWRTGEIENPNKPGSGVNTKGDKLNVLLTGLKGKKTEEIPDHFKTEKNMDYIFDHADKSRRKVLTVTHKGTGKATKYKVIQVDDHLLFQDENGKKVWTNMDQLKQILGRKQQQTKESSS